MASGLILLIEDDPYQQKLYTRSLESAGYTVTVGSKGEMAPRLCDLNGPRLVILDINLPGISGIETCKRIRQQYSVGVPILFVTSTDKLEVMRECIEAGGDDFMVKGANIKGYLERVGYWMGRRCLTPAERQAVLKKVVSQLPPRGEADAPAKEEEASTSSGLDSEAIAQMVAFVADARAGALPEFGRQASEKFILLGYAAGVVNALANWNLDVKMRFVPHLRALLTETQLLSPSEIEVSVGRWHTMYRIPLFSDACRKGEEEYGKRLQGDADARPSPVASLLPSA
jgi:CheY-like chemotaxis protein